MVDVIDLSSKIRKPISPAERQRLAKKIAALSPDVRRRFLDIARPRIVDEYMAHIPHPKQQVFLGLKAREAMYGGAAGGGKSDAILMAALQYTDVPGYSALILRRTWPDLNAPGAILDRANTWFAGTRAHKRDGGRVWEFPTTDANGNPANPARISFGYLNYDKDKYKFQSAEYQFVGFDELTQFDEGMYTYLFSRIRRPQLACLSCNESVSRYGNRWKHSNSGNKCDNLFPDPKVLQQYPAAPDGLSIFQVPLRMRSATNPGGRGHEWVRNRFVDPSKREETAVFIPALLSDNPSLDQASYEENLQHLSPTDRERLLAGDWDVTEQGEMFERWWFKTMKPMPLPGRTVRFWDNAATANGGDWTVGTKVRLTDDGRWIIEDVVRGQWSSLQKEQVIRATAQKDGSATPIRMEQEPGSAGVDVIDNYRRKVLVGYAFDGIRSSGGKDERAMPMASAAEAGNVYLFDAPWNKAWLDEFNVFPKGNNDDQVDSACGALNYLAFAPRARVVV